MFLSDLSQQVATLLADVSGVGSSAVYAANLPELSSDELDSLRVIVVPRGTTMTVTGRSVAIYEHRVGVYLGKRVEDNDAADAMMNLMEAILEQLRASSEAIVSSGASFSEVTVELGNDDSMNERNTFRANIEATYKVVRGG
jgi:hypothetical protein